MTRYDDGGADDNDYNKDNNAKDKAISSEKAKLLPASVSVCTLAGMPLLSASQELHVCTLRVAPNALVSRVASVDATRAPCVSCTPMLP